MPPIGPAPVRQWGDRAAAVVRPCGPAGPLAPDCGHGPLLPPGFGDAVGGGHAPDGVPGASVEPLTLGQLIF